MSDDEERFRPLEGMPGKLFVPRSRGPKKHPCPDCFECQQCSDARCAACREECLSGCARGCAERHATKR